MSQITRKKNGNKFLNMSENDWLEVNELSRKSRGLSSLTFEDIYGDRTEDKVSKILEVVDNEQGENN